MVQNATADSSFLATIGDWCRGENEVLVMVRYRCGAGSRTYRLFSSFSDLNAMIQSAPAGACVTVFRKPDMPLRGVVDDGFITKCLSVIPDREEYLMIEMEPSVAGRHSWYHYGSGESHAELKDDLEESAGRRVSVGRHPSMETGISDAIDAVVADADGIVRAGPY